MPENSLAVSGRIADEFPVGAVGAAFGATGEAKSVLEGLIGGENAEKGPAVVVMPRPRLLPTSLVKPLVTRRARLRPASCCRPFSSLAHTASASRS